MAIGFGFGMPSRPTKAQSQTWVADIDASLARLTGHFDSLWISDHFFWENTPTYEAWTSLSYMAARWPAFKVGTMVLGQGYRNPGLLAKMASTLQILSSGRLILGIGAGWKEDEYLAYGFPFPPARTRLEQLDDTLEIMKRLWTQTGKVSYEGKHYRLTDGYLEPKPDPVPPILVGGASERLLSIAARHADWWNLTECTQARYADRARAAREACEKIGRDPASLRLSWWGRLIVAPTEEEAIRVGGGQWTRENALVGTPAQVAEQMQGFIDGGAEYFMTIIPNHGNPDVIAMVLEDVLPKVRDAMPG